MKKSYKKWFLTKVKRAIRDFDMIHDGDKVAVSVSGGKDSTTLLYVMDILRKYSHLAFDIHAITIDMGWGTDFTPLIEFCKARDIPLHIEKTDISKIVFQHRKEKNPCSLCAKMRHGAVNTIAKKLGCVSVALGHHADDAIETLLMNMMLTARMSCFMPKTYLNRKDIYLIRPMIYVFENTTRSIARTENLPVLESKCPASGATKRQEIKELIDYMEKIHPQARQKLLSSMNNVDLQGLWMLAKRD